MALRRPSAPDETFQLTELVKRRISSTLPSWQKDVRGAVELLEQLEERVASLGKRSRDSGSEITGAEIEKALGPHVQRVRLYLQNHERELQAVEVDAGLLGQFLNVNQQLAGLYTTVVQAWPQEAAGRLDTYIGTVLLGSGSATFIALHFPANWELAAPAVLWAFGASLLLAGRLQVRRWQSDLMDYFKRRLGVLDTSLGNHPTRPPFTR